MVADHRPGILHGGGVTMAIIKRGTRYAVTGKHCAWYVVDRSEGGRVVATCDSKGDADMIANALNLEV